MPPESIRNISGLSLNFLNYTKSALLWQDLCKELSVAHKLSGRDGILGGGDHERGGVVTGDPDDEI